jgi:large subunit ribosomal protein L10
MVAVKKIEQVKELEKFLDGSTIIIGTNYDGVTVSDLQKLRSILRQDNAQYKVVKNRLLRIAASNLGKEDVNELLKGPVGLVRSSGEPASVAKILQTYITDSSVPLNITGAVVDGNFIDQAQVLRLATLPARDVLLSQLLGSLNAPSQSFVSLLNVVLSNIVNVIEKRRIQLEERE